MIHRISTLTFKFHLLLTIETQRSTITWVRESNICNMADQGYCVGTSNKPKPPMGAIVIFPEAIGAQWETLPEISIRKISSGERGASGLPSWCSASCIPEEQVFTRAAPHDWKCWCGSAVLTSFVADVRCSEGVYGIWMDHFQEYWKSKICSIVSTPPSTPTCLCNDKLEKLYLKKHLFASFEDSQCPPPHTHTHSDDHMIELQPGWWFLRLKVLPNLRPPRSCFFWDTYAMLCCISLHWSVDRVWWQSWDPLLNVTWKRDRCCEIKQPWFEPCS